MTVSITRKQFLLGAATASATGVFGIVRSRAARRTVIRFGLDLTSDHPTTVNATAAAKKIKDATKARWRCRSSRTASSATTRICCRTCAPARCR